MCRIAEVLIKLQQSGNVHYIGWKLGFTCQAVLVEKLQNQAKEMEKELEEWNREVALARKMFYELNYYTTRQLLVLRSGLKMSEPSANPHQWRQVKALLESISCEITQTNLVNVVHDIAKKPLEDLEIDIHSPYLADMPVESVIEPSIGVASSPSLLLDEQLVTDARPTEANIPHVGLSKEDLNVEQKTHFTNILERIGYCELTALKAIEAVDGGDWNDIENWLEYNGGEWEEIFQEAQEGEEEEESEGSVIEDEGVETIFDDEAALTQAEIGNTLGWFTVMSVQI